MGKGIREVWCHTKERFQGWEPTVQRCQGQQSLGLRKPERRGEIQIPVSVDLVLGEGRRSGVTCNGSAL